MLFFTFFSGCNNNSEKQIDVILEKTSDLNYELDKICDVFKITIINNSKRNYFIPYSSRLYIYDSLGNDLTYLYHNNMNDQDISDFIDISSLVEKKFPLIWNFCNLNDSSYFAFDTTQIKKAIKYEIDYYLNKHTTTCPNPDTSYLEYLISNNYRTSLFIPKESSIYRYELVYPAFDSPVSYTVKFWKLNNTNIHSIIIPTYDGTDSCIFELSENPLKMVNNNYFMIKKNLVSNKLEFDK